MRRFVCSYPYLDEAGAFVFEVMRWEPKNFSQRQPDGKGGWKRQRDRDGKMRLTMAGCRLVPYHLDQLAAAAVELRERGVVPLALILEGEKDCDRALRGGMLATTCPGGSDKWDPRFAEYFRNFEVALIADNDLVGRRHMLKVARSLLPVAAAVKLVDLGLSAPKADFSDWADAGGTPRKLRELIEATPVLTVADLPPEPAPPRRQAARLPDRLLPYARAALQRAVKAIREAPDGTQQKTLNQEVFGIGQLAGGGQLPEGEALGLLLNAAMGMVSYDARRPWRPAELDRIVRRSFDAGFRKPRDIPESWEGRYG